MAAASVATSMDSSAQARKFLAELEHGSSDGGAGSVGLESFVMAMARNNAEQHLGLAPRMQDYVTERIDDFYAASSCSAEARDEEVGDSVDDPGHIALSDLQPATEIKNQFSRFKNALAAHQSALLLAQTLADSPQYEPSSPAHSWLVRRPRLSLACLCLLSSAPFFSLLSDGRMDPYVEAQVNAEYYYLTLGLIVGIMTPLQLELLVAVAAWTWKRLAAAQSTFARTAAPTPSSTPSTSRTSSAISFSLSFSFPGSSSSSSSGSSGSAGSEAGVGMSSEESLQMYRNVIFVVTFIPYFAIFLHGIGPSDKVVDPKPINAFQFSGYIAYFACFVHMAFQHRLVRSTARWGLITYGVMFILLVGMSTITSFSLGHDREIFYWGYFFQAPFFAMIIWLLVEVVLCWRSGYYHRSQDQTLHDDFKPVISFLCLMTVFLLSVVLIEQLVLPMNVMLEDIIIRGVCVVILYTAPVSINLAGWGRVTSVLRQLLPAAEEIHKVAVSGA